MGSSQSTPPSGNRFLDLIHQLRLAWRLLRDPRVPGWTKLTPFVTLLYVLSPIDLIPDPILGAGQLDDLGLIFLGLWTFIALAPPEVVREHVARMAGLRPGSPPPPAESVDAPTVIDAEYRVEEEK